MIDERLGLDVRGLSVDFAANRQWRTVVDDIDLQVAPGETVGLVGESGSGKSVTSLAIMGLLPKRSARVRVRHLAFQGVELDTLSERELQDVRGNRIAMVFQEPMTSLNPSFTIGAQITESVRRHMKLDRRSANRRAIELLDAVGIPAAARRVRSYPHEMSGGMRQRAMLAIALSCDPGLLIADEPTTALDVTIQSQMLDLIRSVTADRGMGVLFISHDLGVIADIAERVVVMYRGQVVEEADALDLYENPQHPYTRTLLDDGSGELDLGQLGAGPPTPPTRADACRFFELCPLAVAECDAPVDLVEREGHAIRCVRADPVAGASRD